MGKWGISVLDAVALNSFCLLSGSPVLDRVSGFNLFEMIALLVTYRESNALFSKLVQLTCTRIMSGTPPAT